MSSLVQEALAREEEATRCTAVAGMRSSIAEQSAANEERRARLAEVQARVAKLRVSGLGRRCQGALDGWRARGWQAVWGGSAVICAPCGGCALA